MHGLSPASGGGGSRLLKRQPAQRRTMLYCALAKSEGGSAKRVGGLCRAVARRAKADHVPGQRYSTDLYWLDSSRKSIVFSSLIVNMTWMSRSLPLFALQLAFAVNTSPSHFLSLI